MKKLLKAFCYCFIGLIAIALLFISALPTLLSTNGGQKIAQEQLNQSFSGKIAFQNLRLSWLGKQKVEGFVVKNSEGEVVLSADFMSINNSLFSLLITHQAERQIEINNGSVKLIVNPERPNSLPHLLGFNRYPISHPLLIEISNLFIDIHHKNSQSVDIQARGTTVYEGENGFFHLEGNLSDQNSINLEAIRFPSLLINHYIQWSYPKLGDVASSLLQGPLNLQIKSILQKEKHLFSLKGETNTSTASLEGEIVSDTFTINSPAEITFSLTPDLIRALQKLIPQVPKIQAAQNSKGALKIEQLVIPLNETTPSQITLTAEASLPSLTIVPEKEIQSFTATLSATPESPLFQLKLLTNGKYQNQPFSVQGNVLSKKPSDWDHFQEEILDHLEFGLKSDVGSTTANLQGTLNQDALNADLHLQTPQVILKNFHVKSDALLKRTPYYYSGTIADLKLQKELQIEGVIETNIAKKSLLIQGKADGEGQLLNYQIHYPDPFTSTQKWDLSSFPVFLKGVFSHLPLPEILSQLFPEKPYANQITSIFGPLLSGFFEIDWVQGNGPTEVEIKGNHGNLTLKGQLIDNQLTLLQPLQFETDLNSLESRRALSGYLPFLHHLVSVDAPLKVILYPDDFSLSLDSFNINNISFKKGIATLGTMNFDGKGKISQLFTVLNLSYSGPVSLQITPLYLQANQGNFTLSRFDLLLNHAYHLISWGDINLSQDKLNLTLGIDGSAIQKTWGLTEIPPSQFLLVPIKGQLNSPRLDTTKVLSQLSAWKLQSQGKPITSILGVALESMTGSYKESRIPPPTTSPLPWEDPQVNSQEKPGEEEADAEKHEKKKHTLKKKLKLYKSEIKKKVLPK